jgi:hypothetical protein
VEEAMEQTKEETKEDLAEVRRKPPPSNRERALTPTLGNRSIFVTYRVGIVHRLVHVARDGQDAAGWH